MGGSKKKPGTPVAEYYLSQHFGIAAAVDKIHRIFVKDKRVWSGAVSENTVVGISETNLFGGPKKEGGVAGLVHFLMGRNDQLLSSELAAKLGLTPTTAPAYRGISSLFFTGGGGSPLPGFYWNANGGYLPEVSVEVSRAPAGWYPEKAMVPRLTSPVVRLSTSAYLATATAAGGYDAESTGPRWLDPNWLENPDWTRDFGNSAEFAHLLKYNQSVTGTPPPLDEDRYVRTQLTGVASRITQHNTYMLACGVKIGINTAGTEYHYGRVNALYRFLDRAGDLVAQIYIKFDEESNFVNGFKGYWSAGSGDMTEIQGLEIGTPDELNFNFFVRFSEGKIEGVRGVWFSSTAMPPGGFTPLNAGGVFYTLPCLAESIVSCQVSFDVVDPRFRRVINQNSQSELSYATLRCWGPNFPGESLDANPAHVIHECLTNGEWGLGLSASMIDYASFQTAADTLYEEGFGISLMWSDQTSIESFINEILSHIDGSYGVDPSTGKIYLTLMRGGYSVPALFTLDENNSRVTRFQRKAFGETSNEVIVTWTNPDNEKEQTVTVHDTGNFAVQGSIVSSAANYYGIRYAELAMRTAMRDLAKGSNPVASFDIDADRRSANLKSGDVVKLDAPEYGIEGLPIRILTVNYGKPGSFKVQISAIEDVFSSATGSYVEAPGSDLYVEPDFPLPVVRSWVTATPYYFAAVDLGDVEAQQITEAVALPFLLAGTQGNNGYDAVLMSKVTDALGEQTYVESGSFPVTPYGTLGTALVKESVSTGVVLTGLQGGNPPVPGNFILIGSSPESAELCLMASGDSGSAVIRRAQLDTSPAAWPVGTPFWTLNTTRSKTEYVEKATGETVSYKFLTRTSSAQLDPALAPEVSGVMVPRFHLPYRPANVKINGGYWPTLLNGVLTVTFARRNRLFENPVTLPWDSGDVTPEVDTTHTLRLYRVDTNALVAETTGITGTSGTLTSTFSGNVRLVVTAVRDGLESFQPFTHTFEHLNVETRITEDGDTRITEDGDTRILEA